MSEHMKLFRFDAEARFRARVELGEVERNVDDHMIWHHHGVNLDWATRLAKVASLMLDLHAAVDQRRKYTGKPYYVHPMMVAELYSICMPSDFVGIAAAILHDVLEDVPRDAFVKVAESRNMMKAWMVDKPKDELLAILVGELVSYDAYGELIALGTQELSDVSVPSDGNRAARKAKDNQALASRGVLTRLRKMCDLISNTASITAHDPDFSKVYLGEKRQLFATPGFVNGLTHTYVYDIALANAMV